MGLVIFMRVSGRKLLQRMNEHYDVARIRRRINPLRTIQICTCTQVTE